MKRPLPGPRSPYMLGISPGYISTWPSIILSSPHQDCCRLSLSIRGSFHSPALPVNIVLLKQNCVLLSICNLFLTPRALLQAEPRVIHRLHSSWWSQVSRSQPLSPPGQGYTMLLKIAKASPQVPTSLPSFKLPADRLLTWHRPSAMTTRTPHAAVAQATALVQRQAEPSLQACGQARARNTLRLALLVGGSNGGEEIFCSAKSGMEVLREGRPRQPEL